MTTPDSGPDLERLTATLAGWRKPFAVLLAAVGFACLLVCGYCFTKGVKNRAADPTVEEVAPTERKAEPGSRNATEFFLGGVISFAGALLGMGGGGYLLGRLPRLPGATEPETLKAEAAVGGLLGVLLMGLGLGLFVLWFGTAVEWVTNKYAADAWKVVTALLVFLLGCGLAFASTQLLRAEERTSESLRRVSFGTSAALSVVFLVVGLTVANVIVALKVPDALDTTATGFYTLQPETTDLLKGLTTNVTAYTTVSEQAVSNDDDKRLARDLARLLEQCRAANPQRFKYQPLSLTLNKDDIARLRDEHAEFKRPDLGVLLVADGKPGKFVSAGDLLEANQQTRRLAFVGEPKVVSLLLSLTEDQDRTAYFLQGHGEIAVAPKGDGGQQRTGLRLAAALEKLDTVVKPLAFDLVNPKVPDDAAVVVVADPRETIPPEQVAALQAYMAAPRKNGKKGKLVVLSSPSPNVNGKGTKDTGLTALLGSFGVALGNEYTYFTPTTQLEPTETEVVAARVRGQPVNPIAMQFAERGPVLVNSREVSLGRQQQWRGDFLFFTKPGRNSWLEPDPTDNPLAVLKSLSGVDQAKAIEMMLQKQFGQEARLVAVAVSDEKVGRLVVVGSGDAFADPTTQDAATKTAANPSLLAAAVNWLRDRPTAANITGKEVTEFQANKSLDGFKGLFLPVFGTLIAVVALGLGVWAYRRK